MAKSSRDYFVRPLDAFTNEVLAKLIAEEYFVEKLQTNCGQVISAWLLDDFGTIKYLATKEELTFRVYCRNGRLQSLAELKTLGSPSRIGRKQRKADICWAKLQHDKLSS